MSNSDLRSKIRELIASGVLPAEAPPITRPGPTSTPGRTRRTKMLVGGPHQEPCMHSSALARTFRELYGDGTLPGIFEGGLVAYDDELRQIDTLSGPQLEKDPHLIPRLLGAPTRLRGNLGHLTALTERAER